LRILKRLSDVNIPQVVKEAQFPYELIENSSEIHPISLAVRVREIHSPPLRSGVRLIVSVFGGDIMCFYMN
jgi:hypothetical protein